MIISIMSTYIYAAASFALFVVGWVTERRWESLKKKRKSEAIQRIVRLNMEQIVPFNNLFSEGLSHKEAKKKKLQRVSSYKLYNGVVLSIAHGSIVDFESKPSGCIVNAAEESLTDRHGVSQVIAEAGGELYVDACLNMPFEEGSSFIRCPIGEARYMPAPYGGYGKLKSPMIIHACSPDFSQVASGSSKKEIKEMIDKVSMAYTSALNLTTEADIQQIAFPLLSAGKFRGSQPLSIILKASIAAIANWAKHKPDKAFVHDIVLVGFDWKETGSLNDICDTLLEGTIKAKVI